MIHAYDKMYLDDAMKCLGEALDYAYTFCNVNMNDFLVMFIATGYAKQFASGVAKYISGMSGTELAIDILDKSNNLMYPLESQTEYSYSSIYWCGWILAYYQWYTNQSFADILNNISIDEIEKLYPTLHEASEDKFVDIVNDIIANKKLPTKLQQQRKICGYSQKQLADKVGINLRTLQQYEIRAKDINKASVSTLQALSKTLGCQIEDLLEYQPN